MSSVSVLPGVTILLLAVMLIACITTLWFYARSRRRLARQLEETQSRYGLVMRALTESVYDWDLDSDTVRYAHTARAGVTGEAPQEHTSEFWTERVHADDQIDHKTQLVRLLKGDTDTFDCTFRYKTGAGDWRWAQQRGFALRKSNGRAYRMCGTVRDVTEEKCAIEATASNEKRLRLITDNLPISLAHIDADRHIRYVNRGFLELCQSGEDEVVGRHINVIIGSDAYRKIAPYIDEALQGNTVSFETEHDFAGKGPRWYLETYVPDTASDGTPQGFYAMSGDITERKRTEKALRISEERYQRLYDTMPDVCLMIAPDTRLRSVNEYGAKFLGYTKPELIGSSMLSLVHSDDKIRAGRALREATTTNAADAELECRLVCQDGTAVWVHTRINPSDDGGADIRVVCRDITRSRLLAQELAHRATHDGLTDLINRRELEQRLEQALITARERGRSHTLCYMDLDQFKVINDTCGHEAGDVLLRQVADLFRAQMRKTDTLSRIGGDEFAILMENSEIEHAKRVAESILDLIGDYRFVWRQKTFTIGVSIGIVAIKAPKDNVSDILRAADSACYAAKDHGRNRVYIFEPDDEELHLRHGEMEWVAKITRAIEEKRFELYFQPISPLNDALPSTDKPTLPPHYELLLRMFDDGEVVLPGVFLPAAERFNLIGKVDQHVLNMAFDWFEKFPQHMRNLDVCSINLSARSLNDENFLRFVVEKFASSPVPSSKICFEITETAAISNLTSASTFIATLREIGCSFALDDFGSGLSSFAYLKHLDVEYLKIDGVFVKDIVVDPIDFAMVRSIAEIGKVMGKKTVAEYVNAPNVLEALQEIGVDYVQGNYIAKPAPLPLLGQSNAFASPATEIAH